MRLHSVGISVLAVDEIAYGLLRIDAGQLPVERTNPVVGKVAITGAPGSRAVQAEKRALRDEFRAAVQGRELPAPAAAKLPQGLVLADSVHSQNRRIDVLIERLVAPDIFDDVR